MKAKKSNKSYVIEASDAKKFQSKGYDIYDDKGELVAFGAGKMIPAETYLAVLKENIELKKKISESQTMKKSKKEEVKEEE